MAVSMMIKLLLRIGGFQEICGKGTVFFANRQDKMETFSEFQNEPLDNNDKYRPFHREKEVYLFLSGILFLVLRLNFPTVGLLLSEDRFLLQT